MISEVQMQLIQKKKEGDLAAKKHQQEMKDMMGKLRQANIGLEKEKNTNK